MDEELSELEVLPEEDSRVDRARKALEAVDPATHYKSLLALNRTGVNGLLQPLPYSPSIDFHQPPCVVVEPVDTNEETLHLYGHAAYPRFSKALVDPLLDPYYDHLFTALYDMLMLEGRNVALVTNHGQIHDIAIILGSMMAAMAAQRRSFGVLGERVEVNDLVRHANLMLSKMVTTTQIFSIPTSTVLQSVCRCFYSIPQTASRRKSKLDADLARANNIVMRDELEARLTAGGQMLAMAASGSQDLSLAPRLVQRVRSTWRQRRGEDPGEAPSLHLQPLYNGTINLMLTAEYVLPVALALDAPGEVFRMGSITRVRDAQDCHDVMKWIADAHQRSTGVATVYHEHEDDLLDQVRAVLRSSRER